VHDTGCPKTNLMKHPVFPIKQTNKIVKLKCFMMIIISSTNRDAIPNQTDETTNFQTRKIQQSRPKSNDVSGTPSLVKVYKKHWLLTGENNLIIRNKSKKHSVKNCDKFDEVS
jgi:hypothetical protein